MNEILESQCNLTDSERARVASIVAAGGTVNRLEAIRHVLGTRVPPINLDDLLSRQNLVDTFIKVFGVVNTGRERLRRALLPDNEDSVGDDSDITDIFNDVLVELTSAVESGYGKELMTAVLQGYDKAVSSDTKVSDENTGSVVQPVSCDQCSAKVWQDGEVLYDAFTHHVHDC